MRPQGSQTCCVTCVGREWGLYRGGRREPWRLLSKEVVERSCCDGERPGGYSGGRKTFFCPLSPVGIRSLSSEKGVPGWAW